MTSYPVAHTPQHALAGGVGNARTEREARKIAGDRDVRFVVVSHPEVCVDLEALDARFSDALREGWANRTSHGDGWQAAIRFWRPDPALPIGTTARNASHKPVGFACDAAEAARLALAPRCERTTETLRTYKRRANAVKAAGDRFYDGTAEVSREAEGWAVRLSYWRIPPRLPEGAGLTDEDRESVARGLAAPLRSGRPQTSDPFGLFTLDRGTQHVLVTGVADGVVSPLTILAEETEEGDGLRMQDDRFRYE